MNLQLARQEAFNGVTCDFYRGEGERPEIYMTREQIGRALGYSHPIQAVAKIHDRNKDRLGKYSVITNLVTTDGKAYDTYIYSPKGVYEICRWSRQPKADAFMDWVWEVVERLRTGKAGTAPDMAAVIAETVRVTITEFSKQLIPVFKDILTGAKAAPESSEIHIHYPEAQDFIPRRKRSPSIIDHLDEELKKEIEFMLCSPKYSYKDVVEALREYGIHVSMSSVWRYSKRFVSGL